MEYTQRWRCRRLSRDIPVLDKSLCHIISRMFNGIFEIVVHDTPGSGDAGCGSVAGVLHRWLVKLMGNNPIFLTIVVKFMLTLRGGFS
ncbi:MAG: hypothetical protein ACLRWL_05610 [Evtepia gabavorous]